MLILSNSLIETMEAGNPGTILIHHSKHIVFSKKQVKVLKSHLLKVFSDILVQPREKRDRKSRGIISLSIAIPKYRAIQIARKELDDVGLSNMLKCPKDVLSSPELQK
jgi:hypothetical protein